MYIAFYLNLLVKSNGLISVAIHVVGIEIIVGPGILIGGDPGVKCTDGGCATIISTTISTTTKNKQKREKRKKRKEEKEKERNQKK